MIKQNSKLQIYQNKENLPPNVFKKRNNSSEKLLALNVDHNASYLLCNIAKSNKHAENQKLLQNEECKIKHSLNLSQCVKPKICVFKKILNKNHKISLKCEENLAAGKENLNTISNAKNCQIRQLFSNYNKKLFQNEELMKTVPKKSSYVLY